MAAPARAIAWFEKAEVASTPITSIGRAHGAAKATKRTLGQLGPHLRAQVPQQEPDPFAGIAKRQNKEPRASVLAGVRMTDHRSVTVIDLAFLAGYRGDHRFTTPRIRSPVIIYDSQPRNALGTHPGDIAESYGRWRDTFEEHREQLIAACESLGDVREYCVDPAALGGQDVEAVASQRWLHERVLDVYLWHRGLDA